MVDLDSDEEEDEDAMFQTQLQQALEASKSEAQRESRNITAVDTSTPQPPLNATRSVENQMPVFLTGRAQMEKERLERQKRLRKEAGLDDDDEKETGEPSAKRQHVSTASRVHANGKPSQSSSYSKPDAKPNAHASTSGPSNAPTIEQVFWDGEFRPTATQHGEPRRDGRATFRLTEILGKVRVQGPPVSETCVL